MRPARLLLATATATAALAIAAPGAYATAGDWGDKDDSSYSSEHHDNSKKYDEPRGGMHTGGGALAAVNEDDRTKDKDRESKGDGYEESDKDEYGQPKDGYEESGGYEHEKPRGGMDTGGGALATSGSGLAAGSVLLLGGLGAGAYMVRRRGMNAPTA